MTETNINNTNTNPTLLNPDSDVFFPVHVSPVFSQDNPDGGFHMKSPDYKMIKRTDTGRELGIHKMGYTLVRNEDLFGCIEQELINNLDPVVMDHVEVSDTQSYGGAVCSRQYNFPTIKRNIYTTSGHISPIHMRAIGVNCFDGSMKAKIIFGNIDAYCTNGLISGVFEVIAKKRTSGFTIKSMKDRLTVSMSNFEKEMDTYEKWAMQRVVTFKVEEFFKTVASEARAKKLMEQYQEELAVRGANIWSVVSAMTNYSSHNSERFGVRNTGNDNEAKTLLDRQVEVNRWIGSKAFGSLLQAA